MKLPRGADVSLPLRARHLDPWTRLLWGVDDPRDLQKQVPRLRLVDSVPFLTMPDLTRHLRYAFPDKPAAAPPR